MYRAEQSNKRTEPLARTEERRRSKGTREPGGVQSRRRQRLLHPDHFEIDRRQLSKLPPGHSRRSEGTHHDRPRGIAPGPAPRGNHDQRKIEFGEAPFREKQT